MLLLALFKVAFGSVALGLDLNVETRAAAYMSGHSKIEPLLTEEGNKSSKMCVYFNQSIPIIGNSLNSAILRSDNRVFCNLEQYLHDSSSVCQIDDEKSVPCYSLISVFLYFLSKSYENSIHRTLKETVIAVNSYLTWKERQELIQIANAAELDTLSLIDNITSAALQYANFFSHNRPEKTLIMHFDASPFSAASFTMHPKSETESPKLRIEKKFACKNNPSGISLSKLLSKYVCSSIGIDYEKLPKETTDVLDRESFRVKKVLSSYPSVYFNVYYSFLVGGKRASIESHSNFFKTRTSI